MANRLKAKEGPKWDLSKLAMGQFLSMTSYMKVIGIGDKITVENKNGHVITMAKCLLETMYSADHYEREIPMNMTGLAELLQSVQDTIFTINFKKQANEQSAVDQLLNADATSFNDPKKLSQLAKQIVAG